MASPPLWCYFEQQDASLCGQHLLNNLTQGSHFQAADLAQIAHELDAQESQLDTAATGSLESQNVDMAGNFSIQVLEVALERQFGLGLGRDCSSALKLLLQQQPPPPKNNLQDVAFVFNAHDHWYCVRSVHGEFYELNSLKPGPIVVQSAQAVAGKVIQMQNEGWSVFVVTGGRLPVADYGGSGGDRWRDLRPPKTASNKPATVTAFQGKAYSLMDKSSTSSPQADVDLTADGEDAQLAKALRLSMQDFDLHQQEEALLPEPDVGTASSSSGVVTVQLILPPQGKRVRRRFLATSSSKQLFAWAKTELGPGSGPLALHTNDMPPPLTLNQPSPLPLVGELGSNVSIRVTLL